MNKLICIIALVVLIAGCSSDAKTGNSTIPDSKSLSDNDGEYIVKYTTAGVLKARETASLKGKVTILIPYGTILNVKKTDEKSVYDGNENYWYFSKELNLYIFGAYLSDKKPAENRFYEIYYREDCEECPGRNFTIRLGNNKAEKINKSYCHQESYDYKIDGVYKVYPEYIEISWNNYIETSISHHDKEKSDVLRKGYTEKLYWYSEAAGWLYEDEYKLVKTRSCVISKDNCTIDCTGSCKSTNYRPGCKEDDELTDAEYEDLNFTIYCTSKSVN